MRQKHKILNDLLGKKYVLVLEPTPNYKASIRSFLTNLKVTKIKFVSTVKEAKRELLTANIGFFIVEWDLKDENGLQFCRHLKAEAKYQDIPFLLLTVENMHKDVVLASEVGIDGYLLKPFSFEDFTEILTTIAKAKSTPTETNQLLLKAESAIGKGQLELAQQMFTEIHQRSPSSARALCGLARSHFLRNAPDKAIEYYKKAINANPNFLEAYSSLIEVYEAEEMTKELFEVAQSLNERSPGNPKYCLILAKSALELGKINESDRFFKMTIRLSPKLAEAYKGLGKVNTIQEDYESAMKNFKKALDLDSGDVSTLNSLGLVHIKQGQYEEGIDMYRAALKLKPQDSRILFNLGYAKERTGDLEQASFYYKQAMTHQPNFEKARRRLEGLTKMSG